MSFEKYLKSRLDSATFDRVWSSFFTPKNVGFYLNLLKFSKDEIISNLNNLGVEFSEFLPGFYLADARYKSTLSHSELFNSGAIYIQNPSSYLSAIALGVNSTHKTLEMCASPGGKSIAIANIMGQNSDLAVIEADRGRFFTLKKNLAKYGCEWVRTYNKDARSISRSCVNMFDRILLDAPCSSYSHFGDGFIEKSAKEIKAISRLQKQLLNSALIASKPGGVVVYSTCTFFECENEEVVQNALNSNFKIKLISLDFGLENQIKTELGTRILPDNNMSGFFIAKLIKES